MTPKTPGSWLALVATIMGIALPFMPPQYVIYAQAAVAGIGAAAVKLD
jgi:hypothetical protein